MLKRIITGIVAILLFIPICISSHFDGWNIIFPIAIGILSAVGVFEMSKCLGFHKNLFLTIPMYFVALSLPLLRYITVSNIAFAGLSLIIIFGILIYYLFYAMLSNGKQDKTEVISDEKFTYKLKISDALTLFTLNIYVIGCFSAMYMVRTGRDGKYIYLLAFLGAWLCDTFAYFVGVFFGKHKLIPKISPKKTIEGSIGGIIFTIGGFALYGLIVNSFFGADLNYIKLCIFGLILAIVSQIGDLIASLIKRQYSIKDYGFIFPGHGGVLDRFDSVMLTAPVLFILNSLLIF